MDNEHDTIILQQVKRRLKGDVIMFNPLNSVCDFLNKLEDKNREKKKQEEENSYREYNGKKYRYEMVGLNFVRNNHDTRQVSLRKMTIAQYNIRSRKGYYSVWAWVEVGKPSYTWDQDPINKDIFLATQPGYSELPKYLMLQSGCNTVSQYVKKYNFKIEH